MFKTIHLRKLITSLLITLGTGLLAWVLSGNMSDIYQALNKPPLSPPGVIFGIVWTVLYLIMGLSLYLVRIQRESQGRSNALILFALQLAVNFCWPLLFFSLQKYCLSVIWLFLLLILAAAATILFYRQNSTAGRLMLPYLLWCIFAAYLNIGICILN